MYNNKPMKIANNAGILEMLHNNGNFKREIVIEIVIWKEIMTKTSNLNE